MIVSEYKIYPKSGSFNDLILKKYSQTQFLNLDINKKNVHKVYNDPNKISEFLSYLKKVQLTEYRGKILYGDNDIYLIGIYSNSKDFIGITMTNENFIEIDMRTDKGKSISKKYKIDNNSLDMKYIEAFFNN